MILRLQQIRKMLEASNAPEKFRWPSEFRGNLRFQALQISPEDMILKPQDFSSWIFRRTRWHHTATSPGPIREVIFGGQLVALKKKDSGIGPIAVGYTFQHLATKCANSHVITARSNELKLIVGIGVPGGAEAAVHAVRRFVETLEVTTCLQN